MRSLFFSPVFLSIALLALSMTVACKNPQKLTNTVPDGHSSRDALDWTGVYWGTLPCADCEGIHTVLLLSDKNGNTYQLEETYLGKDTKPFVTKGSFSWSPDGSQIQLQGASTNRYQVGENQLFHLDQEGKRVEGPLKELYVLVKENNEIVEKHWKLTELMGKPVPATEKGREAYLMFKINNKSVTGSGGCNTFHGSYSLETLNRIRISQLASTMKACTDMQTESELLKVLEMADNYYIKEDTLILNKARMAPLARFEAVYQK